MTDVDFLSTTFTDKDVVYLMLSGGIGDDPFEGAVAQAKIWKQAIENAGVTNVVNLSSIGADADEVAGSLHAYNLIEHELRQLDGVNLAFVIVSGMMKSDAFGPESVFFKLRRGVMGLPLCSG